MTIDTWICKFCGYKQDFEMTKENSKKVFDGSIKENECPNCKKILKKATEDKDKIIVNK